MSKHDNGPWKVLFEDDGAWIVGKPDEREARGDFSLAYSEIHMARVYHLEANARLIAAAPEMLEALKWTMRHVDNVFALASFSDSERQDYERAKAAIAKAEGR